ncbi:AAA family ATPase [Nakamurella multipartita]|uniref:Transcriptional regulator domain protein n=1 Tax=Nakamurella multipartita (strain ATCC 700099 / DSM 44233 / CIP 104796 / JCM 9543 / NBRC 105858 / Y-104) TaxID=479431 RepID=C8XH94_NAKMY|nr:AAA family ATPase [Nakamurella multipartita]ACV78300.1 transcriptional regulator domain protein [Nakamurella multipartita DSM 44233]
MTRPVVLTEKLRRPEPVGLARRRLEEQLLAPSTSRLDLVVAPPGSGKTTLLARVAAAAESAGSAVGWYRVTADDATESAFVAHLARALHLDTAADESSVTDMLELLDRSPTAPTLVVFDDVHEIAGSVAERALDQFVQLRPPHLRVLVGCRRPPELNIPRLRVSGQLREITSDDLRFRSWEVEELFLSVFREPLSPESAAALTRRTGGWAAGLQLFHLATSGRSAVDRGRAVDDLGGRSKLVRSYLARNVLAELPEERRHFLLRTCTLGTLTGPLCDALLGVTGSSTILDELEHRQLFTSSDDDGHTFRYHEVLRTHLEWALVQEYGAAGAREWYSRSAALLESVGDQRAAVRAYARAEDWGAVGRLLQTRGTGPDAGAAGTDLLLPPAVVEHDPWLSLAQARRRVREGALTAAVDRFRRAESLLDEPDFRDDCQRERSVAAMWASTDTTGMSWAVDGRGSARHWSIPIRLATRRLGPARVAAPALTGSTPAPHELARGIISLLAGDFRDARRTLDAVVADRAAESTHRLLADLTIAVIDLIRDRPGDPASRLGQIALDAEVAGLPWIARLARGLGECVLAATDPAAWRLAACVDQIDECDEAGDAWGAALLTLAAAVTGLLADPVAEAHGFADAAARFRRLDAPVPALWAQALQACALAGRRRPGAAELAGRVATEARAAQVTGAQALAQIAAAMAGAPVGTAPEATGSELDRMIALFTGPAAPTPPVGEPAAATSSIPADQPAPLAASRTVTIRCLGGFSVDIDGQSVDLAPLRPRARALLRLLAMTPNRDVHREHLVDALWPGTDLTVGTRRLQVAVSSVRQLLEQRGLPGGEVVLRHGDAYRLALPPGSVVDTDAFERGVRDAETAAARGDVTAAAALRGSALSWYRGDLLPEDGPAEHVVGERDRLRLLAATTAGTLAQDYRTLGQLRQAVAAARQSVQLDRYQDLAWELLADLHRDAGDDSAAARTRREHAAAQAELELDSVRP